MSEAWSTTASKTRIKAESASLASGRPAPPGRLQRPVGARPFDAERRGFGLRLAREHLNALQNRSPLRKLDDPRRVGDCVGAAKNPRKILAKPLGPMFMLASAIRSGSTQLQAPLGNERAKNGSEGE